MKIFISADIEGIGGVVDVEQTTEGNPEYERARKWMTAEVNAAVEGAFAGGAAEVVVADAHGSYRNILIEDLNPEAQLVTGGPRPLSMVDGIDASFAGAFFIGYHSRAGSRGVLSHTYSGRTVAEVAINGQVYGECGINATVVGAFGVPVLLVTGDATATDEAKSVLPWAQTVTVKVRRGRMAARCLQPVKARGLIRAAAEEAARAAAGGAARGAMAGRPLTAARPTVFAVRFQDAGMADSAAMIPGTERLDDTTVSFGHDDLLVAYRAMRLMLHLARTM